MDLCSKDIVGPGEVWSFSNRIAPNFSDHILRSIPGYTRGHELIIKLSESFLKEGSICYDLGVATGMLIKQLAKHHKERGLTKVQWIGVDCSSAMLEQARLEIHEFDSTLDNIELLQADLCSFVFDDADYIVSYYTMQFISPEERQKIIQLIYDSLNIGGAFVFFEKTLGQNARFQDLLSNLYQDYKLAMGHSPDQILFKNQGLRGLLRAFSQRENMALLENAGFREIQPIFCEICFVGLLAIK